MNMKKVLTATLACATVAAMTGVVASATTLGFSEDKFVITDQATEGTVFLDTEIPLSFSIPAGMVEEGTEVKFVANPNTDSQGDFAAKLNTLGVKYDDYFVLDLAFYANDVALELTNIPMTLSTTAFDAVYVEEKDGSLTKVDSKLYDGFLYFDAPHFSNYVFVSTASGENSESSGSGSGVTTGDNGMTTVAVLGGVALVSLGTVAVVAKARKKSE